MFTDLLAGWNPREYTAADGSVLQFQIHMPSVMEVGKKYPLLVYMHGAGSKRDDNTHIHSPHAHFLRRFECSEERKQVILLAPGCPRNGGWVDRGRNTRHRSRGNGYRRTYGLAACTASWMI